MWWMLNFAFKGKSYVEGGFLKKRQCPTNALKGVPVAQVAQQGNESSSFTGYSVFVLMTKQRVLRFLLFFMEVFYEKKETHALNEQCGLCNLRSRY